MPWPTARLHGDARAAALVSLGVGMTLAALPACLPAEINPQGQQLVAAHDVHAVPAVWWQPEGLVVAYDQPAPTTPAAANAGRLQLMRESDRAVRTLAPRWLPSWGLYRQGELAFVTDSPAQATVVASAAGAAKPDAADLVVVDVTSARELLRVPEFSHLLLQPERFVAFSHQEFYPAAHVGDLVGRARSLGAVRSLSFARDGTAYYIRASDDAWMRVRSPEQTPELLMNEVEGFVLDAEGNFALVDRRRPSGDAPVVVATATLDLRVLPIRAIDCQVNLRHPQRPWVFCFGPPAYATAEVKATAPAMARVIELDKAAVRDTAATSAGELRFHSFSADGRALLVHHAGRMQWIDVETGAARGAMLDASVSQFLPDGTTALALVSEPDPQQPLRTLSRLVWLDANLAPRARLSPPGQSAWFFSFVAGGPGESGWVVLQSGLEEASELRAVALAEPAASRTLATSVRRFVTGDGRVLALTQVSSQDRTGALVLYDLRSGADDVLGAAVLDFATTPSCDGCTLLSSGSPVAFAVRTRHPLAMEGLWLHRLP